MLDNITQRGFIASVDPSDQLVIPFQFNPSKLSDNKTAHYADRQVLDVPGKVFTGPGPRTISFDIQLVGTEESAFPAPDPANGGIAVMLAKLRWFVYPKQDPWQGAGGTGRVLAAPPHCYFGFGTRLLECVVVDLKITETQFNFALAPVRADVSISLQVVEDPTNPLYVANQYLMRGLARVQTPFGTRGGPTNNPFGV